MNSKKELLIKSVYKTGFAAAFCLSMSVCGPFGLTGGIITALISAVFLNITPETDIAPLLTGFLILSFTASRAGQTGVIAAVLLGIALMIPLSFSVKFKKALSESGASGILSLATALTVTILVTNTYFGIGASGDTVTDIIKSYHSLGFHPNWRGILYGTIVMVIMITFPRKFKKAKKVINMAFVALAVTYILNLILVPKGMVSTFEEVGSASGDLFSFGFDFTGNNILIIILSGIAFGINALIAAEENGKKIPLAGVAVSAAASSVFGCPVTAWGNRTASDYISGVISAIAAALIFLATNGFARLPAASCAVVLIVAAWQSLDKPSLKKAFSGHFFVAPIIIIALTLRSFTAAGVLLLFAYTLLFVKSLPADSGKTEPEQEESQPT